jgi:DNA-binding CsgD family transcriptional regulator
MAIVDGRLEDSLSLARRFIERADEAGAPVRGLHYGLQMLLAPALYLGRAEIYLSAFDDYSSLVPPDLQAPIFVIRTVARAICLAQLGQMDEAGMLVGQLLDDTERRVDDDESGASGAHVLVALLQAAVVLHHRAAARVLAARLDCMAQVAIDQNFYTCVARHLGDAAALLGNRTTARSYYGQAIEAASKIRFRPELALIHLRLAELLHVDETDRSEALEHLNLALPELRDMHMQPALARGLSLLQKFEHEVPLPESKAVASPMLTGREHDVARLLSAGRSNREIADALVITEGTVEVHVKHILSKLGMRSRSQVAAWAADERV